MITKGALALLNEQPDRLPTPRALVSGKIRLLARRLGQARIDEEIAERLISWRRQPTPDPSPDAPLRWFGGFRAENPTTMSLAGWAAISMTTSIAETERAIRRLSRQGLISAEESRSELTITATDKGFETLKNRRRSSGVDAEDRYPPSGKFAELYELRLRNFKCFGKPQRLSFCREGERRPARWTVLVGENGVGKTTILKLIAALYPQERSRRTRHGSPYDPLAQRYDFSRLIFEGGNLPDKPSVIEAKFFTDVGNGAIVPLITGALLSDDKFEDKYDAELLIELDMLSTFLSGGEFQIFTGLARSLPETPLVAAYGVNRYVGGTKFSAFADVETGIRSLFEDGIPLKNPEEWLLRADYSARFDTGKKSNIEDRLQKIRTALVRLLPDVSAIAVSAPDERHDKPYVTFTTPFGKADLAQLSFGYQSTIGWIIDFASRLFERYEDLPDPLAGPALVLIDEIDLHVHPRWQRTIMRHLEAIFPHTQFITSTHSPLVLQGSSDVNIALLKRVGKEVCVVNDLDELQSWRVDQILTSDLFGLDSARPEYIESLERRRIAILGKEDISAVEAKELAVIDDALAKLPMSADRATDLARKLILDVADEIKAKGSR